MAASIYARDQDPTAGAATCVACPRDGDGGARAARGSPKNARAPNGQGIASGAHMSRKSRCAVAAVVLAGCAYEPSTFTFMTRPSQGTRATIGCLDLAISSGPTAGVPILAYEFGNRCDRSTVVDLGRARVVGYSATGAVYPLAPYDPRGEIRPALLDGRDRGRERIAYYTGVNVLDVCVDVAAIAGETPAQWLCLRTGGS
jgi:hypothetical protein